MVFTVFTWIIIHHLHFFFIAIGLNLQGVEEHIENVTIHSFLFPTIKQLSEEFVFAFFPSTWETVTQILQFIDCLPKLSLNIKEKKYFNNAAWRFAFTSKLLIKQLNKYCRKRRKIFTQHFQYLQKKFTSNFWGIIYEPITASCYKDNVFIAV